MKPFAGPPPPSLQPFACSDTAFPILLRSHGIVHGDLKPANLLLQTHGGDRRGYTTKISDFGLARMFEQAQVGRLFWFIS